MINLCHETYRFLRPLHPTVNAYAATKGVAQFHAIGTNTRVTIAMLLSLLRMYQSFLQPRWSHGETLMSSTSNLRRTIFGRLELPAFVV